jgi:hypothetical protein
MKKGLLIIISIFMVSVAKAQIYVGFNTGYSIGTQGRTLGDFYLINGNFSGTITDDAFIDKRSSLGGGFNAGPFLGYKLNQYVGFEMGINFHHTNKISTEVKYSAVNDKLNVSLVGNLLSFKPSVIAFISNGNPKVYSKLGVIYNTGNFKFNYDRKSFSSSEFQTLVLKNGKALGTSFSLGSDWDFKRTLILRIEVFYNMANYYPSKAELTKSEVNGKDILLNTPADERVVSYSKTGLSNGEYYGAAFGKGVILRPQIPMNGVGINVGIIYTLGSSIEK